MPQLLQWHAKNKSMDGLVCHVADNKTWAHKDETWPDFANEPWNLRLAISTNVFNPFFEKLCQCSTWFVYILLYNLLSWLVTKQFFMLISWIMLGKEIINKNNIDAFLTSLVEELKTFRMPDVEALDFAQMEGYCFFNLHAMVMWTINDFPRYGLSFRCVHQRYIACLKCEPKTTSWHSSTLRKAMYMGHHRWLQCKHPYRLPHIVQGCF
jgi:hypothetical protein